MPHTVRHLTREELETRLSELTSPRDNGLLELIVRRPRVGEREVLPTGTLDMREGLVGDNWIMRGSSRTPDKTAHPNMQVNVMNSRVIQLIAQEKDRWPLAGDQLFVDLDLSDSNLPAGTRLTIGSAVIEVTPEPHTGCAKFVERFGVDAMKFVNSPSGRTLRLRGLNARVVQPGTIRVGDPVIKT
jgi:hypothetical protein